MTDYKAAWRERTRTWAATLLGGCCADCGTTEHLDFDHVDASTKAFDISVGIRDGYSRVRLQAELEKCQLRCETCHLAKSLARGDMRTVDHGGGMKGRRNCLCDPCKARRREYQREYMRQRRANMRM